MRVVTLLTVLSVLANASYETASNYYDAKEYKKAIEELKNSPSEYSNPKLHLLWAKSAEALGNTKEAMSAYERVNMLDENSTESRVKLFKIYKNSSRDTLAKEMSSELKNYQLTPSQRTSLQLITDDVQEYYKAKASLSIGYDSNINVSSSSDDLKDYYGYGTYSGEKATSFARLNGSLNYINELDEKGGWYVQGDLKIYYQNNFDASTYNLFVGSLEAGVGYRAGKYSFYMPLAYDRVNYYEKDLLGQVRLTPKVNMAIDKSNIVSASLKYTSKSYVGDTFKGFNDTSYGLGTGYYYLFDKNFTYINLKYDVSSAEEKNHYYYVDKSVITLSTGINYNLLDLLVTKLDYKYQNRAYDDGLRRNPTKKREDEYHKIELKLSHYVMDKIELFISAQYIENSSNYVPAEYSKNITMLGLSANY